MHIPLEIITTIIGGLFILVNGAITYVFSQAFNSIENNRREAKDSMKLYNTKSESMDAALDQKIHETAERHEKKIDEVRKEMKEIEERYRQNDHLLFKGISVNSESLNYEKGFKDGVNSVK